LFIQEVTKSSSHSAVASRNISQAHRFLDAFSDLCFSDVTGLLRDARVADVLILDVHKSLHSLNKALAAHREAWRYICVASEVKRQQIVRERTSTISSEADDQKKVWREEMKHRSQLWKERAGPGVQSALFDGEEMESLLSACSVWTDRLRHTLSIVLLVSGKPSPHCPTNEQAVHLGIAHMLERQRRLGLRPSENYLALSGRLRKSVTNVQQTGLMKTVYSDGSDETDVLVEVRPYGDIPAGSVRQLTWNLSASSHSDTPSKQPTIHEGYEMLTPACLGYIDDPNNARSLVLYSSPKSHPWASNPPTLHETITKGWASKLSLRQRFISARTLAASVLDVHTSGSMHSNITSDNITMLPRNLNDAEPSPYMLGWGVGSHTTDASSLLGPNLYRHRTQFGQNVRTLSTEQDIYSLGVVLLEIGLWTTMSTVFIKLLQTTPRFGLKEEKAVFSKVNRVILDLAYSPDLRREMGERYAVVVQRCLGWSHEDVAGSLLEFRKHIVDALDAGCRL
jgi:hypothetical protein